MTDPREALLDLAYALVKPLLPLYAKLPWLTPRPWVRERQLRELHRP